MQIYKGYVVANSVMEGDKVTLDGFLEVRDIHASSEEEAHQILSAGFFDNNPHRSPSSDSYVMHISW